MELGSIFLLLAVVLLVGLFISRPLFQRSEPVDRVKNTSGAMGDETIYSARTGADADHTRSSLLAEYDRLLNTIQELEFDHTLGKIPPEDYPVQRAALLQAGADVLKKLDAIRAAPAVPDLDHDLSRSASAVDRFANAAQKKLVQDGTSPVISTPMVESPEPSPDELAPVSKPVMVAEEDPGPQTAAETRQSISTGVQPDEPGADADLERLIATRRQARSEKSSGFCPHCGKPVQKSDRYCPKCGTTL
jgi:hypothetical protein